jgi:hypothetical protein
LDQRNIEYPEYGANFKGLHDRDRDLHVPAVAVMGIACPNTEERIWFHTYLSSEIIKMVEAFST